MDIALLRESIDRVSENREPDSQIGQCSEFEWAVIYPGQMVRG